jgi:hypothetical protein
MSARLAIAILLALFVEQPQRPVARDPDLRRELLRRVEVDQQTRFALIDWLKAHDAVIDTLDASRLDPVDQEEYGRLDTAMKKADADNIAWLKELVDKQGWPTITQVRQDGAHAAWCLVQHATADRPFQRRCLDLMSVVPADEISARHVAYLTDRVLLAEGKKQLYGTQCTSAGGRWEALPLEDEAHVDERRAKIGMEPLADYLRSIEETYGPAKKS